MTDWRFEKSTDTQIKERKELTINSTCNSMFLSAGLSLHLTHCHFRNRGELLCTLSFRRWCKCLEGKMQFPSLETTYRKTDNFNYISSHNFVLMHDMIEPVWLQCAMSSTWTKVDTIKPLKMIDCDFGEKMSSCKILDFILKSLRML